MFENIKAAPADPILGLADIFYSDTRAEKINLGIGVYTDETGKTPIMQSVKKAEQYLLENETSKNYLGIDGLPDFARYTQQLLFGRQHPVIAENRAHTAQTPGGTAALRIAADFIVQQTAARRIWVSSPTWPNHKTIFTTAGLEVREYNYYNAASHDLDFANMLKSLADAGAGDVVLFHGCCHNPTGIDPDEAQWTELAELSATKGWLPLFDIAYQGLAEGLEEDVRGLRTFAARHQELIVASSYSKNFGLYNERVGACTFVAHNQETADRLFSQIKAIIRANYSNPPAHGAAVVATILSNTTLRTLWQQELISMRQRIQQMRQLFVKMLKEKGTHQDFSFIARQKGMFSFSGLTQQQILRLRSEFGIYAVNSGRINVAGMTPANLPSLCAAIAAVVSSADGTQK